MSVIIHIEAENIVKNTAVKLSIYIRTADSSHIKIKPPYKSESLKQRKIALKIMYITAEVVIIRGF